MLPIEDREEDHISDINMTPFIDIMLVLLIIFMVTSSVSLESALDINLPQSKSKGFRSTSKAAVISIDRSGKIFVQNELVSKDLAESKIKQALEQLKSTKVVLEGDQSSQLGTIIELIDIAKFAGATEFAIAAQE